MESPKIQGHIESKDIILLVQNAIMEEAGKAAVLQVAFPALTNKQLMEKSSPLRSITRPRSPGKPESLTGYPQEQLD